METGERYREGGTVGGRQEATEEEGYGRGNRQIQEREMEGWRGREGEEERHAVERQRGYVRETRRGGEEEQTPGRDRDGREMEGHLRYRELGPPNSSGFQGYGDGGVSSMIPNPCSGSELTPPTSPFHFKVPLTP